MAELQSVLTPISANEFGYAVLRAIRNLNQDQLALLIAHWAGETGWGKSMHCWNPGNAKGVSPEGNWCFFGCDENIKLSTAQRLKADATNGHLVTIRKNWTDKKGVEWANVWFDAPHPWSKFQAFHTLDEGVTAYLNMLKTKFNKAWDVLMGSADPETYARALKEQGYYTAGVDAYVKLLNGVIASVRVKAADALSMVEKIKEESVPLVS
jgi:flagellum-specific peptidoglycan hydrolase FlgJ